MAPPNDQGGGSSSFPPDLLEEASERQSAECEFVAAAYSAEEARSSSSSSGLRTVHRFLRLGDDVEVELVATMPVAYPCHESSPLRIDGCRLREAPARRRRAALDALPDLTRVCREAAEERRGEEAVSAVLAAADEWARERGRQSVLDDDDDDADDAGPATPRTTSVLARLVVRSHHIIARSKRRAIANAARELDLGGYVRVGWPGLMLLEGDGRDCDAFWERVRRLRWQRLEIMGRETATAAGRSLPFPLRELSGDEGTMSRLAALCRERGREDMFRTSVGLSRTPPRANDATRGHGVLVRVDHMNDAKGYRQWIRGACRASGCDHVVFPCCRGGVRRRRVDEGTTTNKTGLGAKPSFWIVVIRSDDAAPVRSVMKQWRTSRVDVDSRGKSCLERMMTVLVEGPTELGDGGDGGGEEGTAVDRGTTNWNDNNEDNINDNVSALVTSKKSLLAKVRAIGGEAWAEACEDLVL